MVIMHMSGAYEPQSFWKNVDARIVDAQNIEGTNCYCDDLAKEALREQIVDLPMGDIHFLDSGNYHYLSLLWLEKIKEDFALVLFDHHPDMQPPSFGGITSCGGWVLEAMETNPHLKAVYTVGVDKHLLDELELPDMVHIGIQGIEKETLPIYISFDKDVLVKEDAVCDWDQGEMTLKEALGILDNIAKEHTILGMDVCGEDSKWEQSPDAGQTININNATNQKLLEWWQSKQETKC